MTNQPHQPPRAHHQCAHQPARQGHPRPAPAAHTRGERPDPRRGLRGDRARAVRRRAARHRLRVRGPLQPGGSGRIAGARAPVRPARPAARRRGRGRAPDPTGLREGVLPRGTGRAARGRRPGRHEARRPSHRGARPPEPAQPGRREAGQPRRHAAHCRRRRGRRRRRRRPGHRLGQPQRRPGEQGHRLRTSRRERHDGARCCAGSRPTTCDWSSRRRRRTSSTPTSTSPAGSPSRSAARSTEPTAHSCDAAAHLVRIPMRGRANSLNVAASAAIVLYEAVRQRDARAIR